MFYFFWGLEDIILVFIGIWDGVEINKVVGVFWLNDLDGNVWVDFDFGFLLIMVDWGY